VGGNNMQNSNDGFNPESAEKLAKFLGEYVSKRSENLYRAGIAFRESSPVLSNIFMLGFILVTGNDVSTKLKLN
jgi:hypothetical protein